ncbi:MAG: hypothetical protein JNL07_09705 [Rhodospirillales bacterium]|nr:hypothetical protein [Rhodospirillales bacterium]
MMSTGRLASGAFGAASCLAVWLSPAGASAEKDDAFGLCRKPPPPEAGAESRFLDVPGGDIFGFTDPSDIGRPGECGFALEFTGRAGKRHGRYVASATKYEFGATVTESSALAFSAFTSSHHVHNVPDLDNRSSLAFDGLSVAAQYQFLKRNERDRVAMTAEVEPRWARAAPSGGGRIQAYAVELKLLADMPLGERWSAAGNLNYAPAWEKGRGAARFSRFSGTNVSAAIAWAPDGADSRFVFGAESRLLAAFEGLALNRRIAHAWFMGPAVMVNIVEGVALNAAWTPQVRGDGRGVRGRRDLDNFERQQFRVKLAVGL